MKWLVSFKGHWVYQRPDGSLSPNADDDFLWLIDKQPVVFVATCVKAMHELGLRTPDPHSQWPRAMNVSFIYSAFEVPDGMLTAEQEDWLQ